MMHSHLYSLIAKAHRYQMEPDRFELLPGKDLAVLVHGANGNHEVRLDDGHLVCDCDGFRARGEGICAHVLGVEHHFPRQVPRGAVAWPLSGD